MTGSGIDSKEVEEENEVKMEKLGVWGVKVG